MKQTLFKLGVSISNSRPFQFVFRKFTNSPLSRHLINQYIRRFQVNTDEIARPLQDFYSLNDFFIRTLKPDARPGLTAEHAPETIISPVDAKVESCGPIDEHLTLTVKGRRMSLVQLLGDREAAAKLTGGSFAVLYLSPADYHRIHAPFSAELVRQYSLGAVSKPVNEQGLRLYPNVLSTNYRMIYETQPRIRPDLSVPVVFVGATNVNSIVCKEKDQWKRGKSVAYFQFGSTVVLFFPPDSIDTAQIELLKGKKIKAGDVLTRFCPPEQ